MNVKLSREQKYTELLATSKVNCFDLPGNAIATHDTELFDWLLIQDDVDWNMRTSSSGCPPLYYAMANRKPVTVIRKMIERGADVYMESIPDSDGDTLSILDATTWSTSYELSRSYIDLLRPYSSVFFRHTKIHMWPYERCEGTIIRKYMKKVTEEIQQDLINVVSMFVISDCAHIVVDYV